MKGIIAALLLLTLGAAAEAKLTPDDPPAVAIAADDPAMPAESADAMRERGYFSAPQPLSPSLLCSPRRLVFDKTRLAQLCR